MRYSVFRAEQAGLDAAASPPGSPNPGDNAGDFDCST